MIETWQKSYPHIDVPSQIQWAHNWLIENPKRDKKDYVRFLGNWMRSAETRALERQTNVIVHKPYREQNPPEDEIMTGEDIRKLHQAIRGRL